MKVYKTKSGIVVEDKAQFYLLPQQDWDHFINNDTLYADLQKQLQGLEPLSSAQKLLDKELEAPVQGQEIWASGVTYYNSKMGREEESKESGGSSFYSRVYVAERPELFFKATAYRTVPSGGKVRKRSDSTWDVPEPELTLMVTSSGKIIGYTVGNDMSSRSIEGDNPLYLPQAKTYDGSASVGPCILITEEPLALSTQIHLQISRKGSVVFEDSIGIDQIKRKFSELVGFLYRECSFPHGSLLMTGTGIVPASDFNLASGDEIRISIDGIGTLINQVA